MKEVSMIIKVEGHSDVLVKREGSKTGVCLICNAKITDIKWLKKITGKEKVKMSNENLEPNCQACKRDVPLTFTTEVGKQVVGLCSTCCDVACLVMVSPDVTAMISLPDSFDKHIAIEEQEASNHAFDYVLDLARQFYVLLLDNGCTIDGINDKGEF